MRAGGEKGIGKTNQVKEKISAVGCETQQNPSNEIHNCISPNLKNTGFQKTDLQSSNH